MVNALNSLTSYCSQPRHHCLQTIKVQIMLTQQLWLFKYGNMDHFIFVKMILWYFVLVFLLLNSWLVFHPVCYAYIMPGRLQCFPVVHLDGVYSGGSSTWDQGELHVLQYYCSRCKDQKATVSLRSWRGSRHVSLIFYEHVSFTTLTTLLYIQQSRITSERSTAPDTVRYIGRPGSGSVTDGNI